MSTITHWNPTDDLFFKNPEGFDFISPASQDTLLDRNNPGWLPVHQSRADTPYWTREDPLRKLSYEQIRGTEFSVPMVEFPAGIATPEGTLSIQTTSRKSNLRLSDRDLYDAHVQRLFALISQFDTLTSEQAATFLSASIPDVEHWFSILHAAEVVESPTHDWAYQETLGNLWRMNTYSHTTRSYYDGLDALTQLVSFGGRYPDIAAPGAGARSSIKHNLYAAEMMLRLCEGSDRVIGVWGDLFASEQLFHPHDPKAQQRQSHGDSVIVTKDGVVIITEVVGSVKNSRVSYQRLIDRAASWVGVISNSPLDLRVLFLDTSWTLDRDVIFNAVDIGVQKQSAKYAPYEFTRAQAMQKVGIVDASWWFPADRTMSRAATRLGAYVPAKYTFEPFDLPDPGSCSPERRKDIVTNTITALHTPSWIRKDFVDRDWTH